MSRSLYALIRVTCCAALVACVTAVGLGRSAPEPATFGLFKPSRLEALNGYHFESGQLATRFFDPDRGGFVRLELPGTDLVDSATFADWEDDEGNLILVGRWVKRVTPHGVCDGYGLGRYRVPGGEVIDRVPLDIMPISRACFVPGRKSAVVFAAGDGKLYHLDFEPNRPGSRQEDQRPTPVAVEWTKGAGTRPLFFEDPVWPTDERLAGRMLVSVTVEREIEPGGRTRINEIWWLQFSPDWTAVVASGRLIQPRLPEPRTDGSDEVQPCVSATPERGLTLAYLSRENEGAGWDLTAAPIEIDPATGVPTVRREALVRIAEARAHASMIFSSDGRWLFSLPRRSPKPEHFERHALPESVWTSPSRGSHVAARTAPTAWN